MDFEYGLNLYDYEARYTDAAFGRFTTVDPMAEKYYSMSPYAYCANNPILNVNPDGRDWRVRTHYNDDTKKIEYQITVNAVLYNSSSNQNIDMAQLGGIISSQVKNVCNISQDDFVTKMDFNLKVVNSIDEIGERDHVIQIVDQNQLNTQEHKSDQQVAAIAARTGLEIRLGVNLVEATLKKVIFDLLLMN